MSIQREIIVRYRATGHVRFELPEQLCTEPALKSLSDGLLAINGIYRIDASGSTRKLSIRYIDGLIDLQGVARALSAIAAEAVTQTEAADDIPDASTSLQDRVADGVTDWIKNKSDEVRETFSAIGIIFRNTVNTGVFAFGDREKLTHDFLTDVLVFYLIKIHWHMITQHWLKRPLLYRYEWMAAIYMIYLLVRSRRPKTS